MAGITPRVKRLFNEWGKNETLIEIEKIVAEMIERRIPYINGVERGLVDPRIRAKRNLQVIQQTQLHRAERAMTGAIRLFGDQSMYGVALLGRSLIETAAVVGFFCVKIENLALSKISFDDLQRNIWLAMAGAKHEFFKEAEAPVNILTCIAQTDAYLDSFFFERTQRMLRDSYDWLSEFAHPNYLSNQLAFKIEKDDRVVFRHGGGITEDDFQLTEYVAMVGTMYLVLFDRLKTRIDDGTIDGIPL